MAGTLIGFFSALPDPRQEQGRRHRLADMVVIAILGVLCGAEGWAEVAQFGEAKKKWLATFLPLPHGIPSHDTFGRVFAVLDPDRFEACFTAWTAAVAKTIRGVVAIDGKTIRRSFDKGSRKAAVHMLSAWAADNAVVFGQLAVEDKSNEITAIPRLLKMLHIKGLIITIDAVGCQKKIARLIVKAGGDYVLRVKANQAGLLGEIQDLFQWAIPRNFEGMPWAKAEQTQKDHGRIETRRVWATWDLRLIRQRQDWPGLSCVIARECTRVVGDRTSVEWHFCISSLPRTRAEELARICRSHWGVENGLHWSLDVGFGEDASRVRTGHAAENCSRLRRIGLNLLKREKTCKVGIKGKRLRCGWDHDYLLTVLGP